MNQSLNDHPRPLAMDPGTFRSAGHQLVDRVAAFLESIPDGPVTPAPTPEAVRAALRSTDRLPDDGADPATLLESAAALLFDHSLLNAHPRFFGYVTSSPAPIGILAELLAAAVNANVGAWTLSPMASEIEAQTVRWIAELIGYPSHAGLLVSGGNMANITGLLAARTAALGEEAREMGVGEVLGNGGRRPGQPAREPARARVYASPETHTWLQKAVDLAGLGTASIRWVETDAERRMEPDALRRALEADAAEGDVPAAVVASAGTVSTGAVDPLPAIADICREHDVWLHVDGAYGAFAAAAPGAPDDLAGMARADSVALDPHKWLYAPLEAGCVLVKDGATLRAAFAYHPPYYHFGTEAINYVDLGPQNSRGFRALKVWLALRHAGRRGYTRMIGRDMHLTERLYASVEANPELEAVSRSLSIATFRYVPPDLAPGVGTTTVEAYLNLLNETLLDRIQALGDAFVSNAVLEGRYVLRSCIVNLYTTEADVDALPGIVTRLGRHVDGGLRSILDERGVAAMAGAAS